jgi:hypothetical protein
LVCRLIPSPRVADPNPRRVVAIRRRRGEADDHESSPSRSLRPNSSDIEALPLSSPPPYDISSWDEPDSVLTSYNNDADLPDLPEDDLTPLPLLLAVPDLPLLPPPWL